MVILSQLTKSYQTRSSKHVVLSDIDLHIEAGEFVAIMGSSGSGKSTLLNLISGFDYPTIGTVKIDGKYINLAHEKEMVAIRRSKIGFVFQDYQLIPHLSLWENVLIAGLLLPISRTTVLRHAHSMFERFGLIQLQHRLPAEVSGGEQQRAAIIRALINQPQLLLADEPTGNLNSAASLEIMNCFRELHQEGQTITLVTHEPTVASYAQRVIFLQDGSIKDILVFEEGLQMNQRRENLHQWLEDKSW